MTLVARDAKKNPLFSRFPWSDGAVERLFRVPAGFMRQRTQERIEELAAEREVGEIDLELVEAGIRMGREFMEQMIRGYEEAKTERSTGRARTTTKDEGSTGEIYLNEVGLMSAMNKKRNLPEVN